jgi:hypothetical protein
METPASRAERWRARAEEIRTVSEQIMQPGARVALLQLAQCFDEAARHIENASASVPGAASDSHHG